MEKPKESRKRQQKLSKEKKSRKEFDEYSVTAGLGVLVKSGDVVKKGQPLSEGSFDIKEILVALGKKAAEEYIVKEIKKIYVSQGADIDDRWLEVIVRLMFSRVQIKNPGDSNFLPGEIIDKSRFFLTNDELKKAKKKPVRAYQLVQGISKVALGAEGFLSAASFQHTARVLIDASLAGKVDYLRGLKENVIIGKMIPCGTGYRIQDRTDSRNVKSRRSK